VMRGGALGAVAVGRFGVGVGVGVVGGVDGVARLWLADVAEGVVWVCVVTKLVQFRVGGMMGGAILMVLLVLPMLVLLLLLLVVVGMGLVVIVLIAIVIIVNFLAVVSTVRAAVRVERCGHHLKALAGRGIRVWAVVHGVLGVVTLSVILELVIMRVAPIGDRRSDIRALHWGALLDRWAFGKYPWGVVIHPAIRRISLLVTTEFFKLL
jgi:hypothetical protein